MKRLKILVNLILLLNVSLICASTEAEDSNTARYTIDLREIVVTPSRIGQEYKYSTQNMSIISREDIESSGVTEVTEILDLLPSVDILEYGSTGSSRSVHTRGASNRQVLTLIDGRPVTTPQDGETDFNRIPLSNIERIEVLRGPAASIYGAGAVGGVINIITKSGTEDMHTEVMGKFGSFSTKLSSVSHGYKIGALDYFASYDYLASHGHRDNADYLSHNFNTKVGYQLNADNRLGVAGGYCKSDVGTPGRLSSIDLDDRQEAFRKYLYLTYDGKMMEGQDITLKVFHNIDRLEFIETFDPIDKDAHQTKVYGVDVQLSQVFFDVFRTAIGSSFYENRLNSSASGKHDYHLKAVYVEAETDLFDISTLKLGTRWDDYSNFGDRFSPSASLSIWLFDKFKLHGLVAKSFRAPTFNDLYWPREPSWQVEGNPDLEPETAVSYEAGISGYFLDRFKTDITFFKTDFDDLIEWALDSSWWYKPTNLSSATIQGAEFETEFVLEERLKANLNYTYLEATNDSTDKWLNYRPRHLYKLRLSYSPITACELGINAIYKTKRFANADNTVYLKHYFVMNSNLSYKIRESVDILLEVKNIFDRVYYEEREYSVPGRAFYGGLRFKF